MNFSQQFKIKIKKKHIADLITGPSDKCLRWNQLIRKAHAELVKDVKEETDKEKFI